MPLYVKKFGGSSVADTDKMRHIAERIIREKQPGDQIVIVVSAMGDTTDHLLDMVKKIGAQGHGREVDRLLSTGEQMSIALLALTFNKLGVPAVSLTGPQAGILCDGVYGKADIIDVKPDRVFEELAKGNIVIVAGFQGRMPNGDVATLGRGGSDATAVALAGAMHAKECEIYTDVEGVYSADPRYVPNAFKMDEISNTEMLEMARLGAGVMQPRSIELGMYYKIPIRVRSTFSDDKGTLIREGAKKKMSIKRYVVKGIAQDVHTARVSVLNVKNVPNMAHSIFAALADKKIDVDLIVQSVKTSEDKKTDIVFTVNSDDLDDTRKVLDDLQKDEIFERVIYDDSMAKVSIVGAGMLGTPGIAAKMFGALGKAGVNILIVSTSEISVSCLINRKDVKKAVQAIHKDFFENCD